MKKRILLGLLGAALLMTLLVTSAKAQTFVASFGVEHHWRVPMVVSHYIDDYYYNYDWVHTRRIAHHGIVDYEVILQRGDVFIEVTIDTFGRVFRTVRRNHYPLHDHVCGGFCGYHSNYYAAYYNSCNSHSHHGHNHVSYYNRPNGYAYGHHNHHGGHGNNGYKNGNKKGHANNHKSQSDQYPSRRGEYYKNNDRRRGSNDRGSESGYKSRESSANSNPSRDQRIAYSGTRRGR